MKPLIFLLAALLFVLLPVRGAEKEKKHFVLYATLLERMPVDLADGARWMMEKGDSFPVDMFKDQQRRAILKLAGTTFTVDTKRVRILSPNEVTEEVVANYRANVETYINTRSDQWKEKAAVK